MTLNELVLQNRGL